jgi:hypothetical protein
VGLATPAVKSSQDTAEDRPRRRSRAPFLVLASYLLGAIYVTVLLWVDPAGRAQAGDMHDVDQMAWFMRYSEQAITHFHLPALVTSVMNAPHTVNLMWNTSLLLPGIVMSPVTVVAGPQVSLNVLLVLGFAGSAASLYYVLRRWGVGNLPAALAGALYGFSPAMIGSGIGHYHLVLLMLPPLMIDALLRIVTGRGSGIKNGIWLGILVAAQLFIGEEALIDTVIAAVVLLVVLVLCHPQVALERARRSLGGLAAAAVVAIVLCARGLWVQFHGVHSSGAYNVVQHQGKLTHLYTIPYAWVVPGSKVLIHTAASGLIVDNYPQPQPEYLAYLGIPLVILLLAIGVYYWRILAVRVMFLTFLVLELLSLGGQPIGPYPGKLLPWYWAQGLPVLSSTLPDRLCLFADGAAAAMLAFALHEYLARARTRERSAGASWWRAPATLGIGVTVLALLPLFPTPYTPATPPKIPFGYLGSFRQLNLPAGARVLVVPVPNGAQTWAMRWYADTGLPTQMIGGDFIDASAKGRESRSGRAGETQLGNYLNQLWGFVPVPPVVVPEPTQAEIKAQMASWKPAAIVADTQAGTPLGQFLIKEFGQPTVHVRRFLAWKLPASGL